MAKFEDCKRLNLIYDKLIEKGLIKNQADFSSKINYSSQGTLNQMLNGNRPVALTVKLAVCEKFKVSQNYMMKGKGDMFEIKKPSEIERLKTEVKNLKEQLKLKDEIIKLLRKRK